jgi:ABC-type Fe3+/spermidine/putrescine transport system ATPase subunit
LGALDRRLRQEMQVELRDIQRRSRVTAIFVTHDQEEALTLSDRIAIINEGRLIQIGKPGEVYELPQSVFAAQFLGDANVFHGRREGNTLAFADGTVIAIAAGEGDAAIVRPEKLFVTAAQGKPPGANTLQGEILQAVYSGASVTYRIKTAALGETPLLAFIQNQTGEVLAPGSAVTVSWDPRHTIPVAR